MSPPDLHIALLGTKFMGRAHSNAWTSAPRFFDLPLRPVKELAVGRDRTTLDEFASRWGWARTTTRWQQAVTDDAVDLVDVATPNNLHADQAIAALEAGKHVACEKPLAGTLDDARRMARAAARAPGRTFVWYSYRGVPAVALARQLVQEGRLGRLYHVRAAYLQGSGLPTTPMKWRYRRQVAGSGAHGDLNAHIVDMARFITGDEITEVTGAVAETFVKRRVLAEDPTRTAPSTVDDAVLFLARFAGGAVGSFEATRMATGMKNSNRIELHGERGALRFDFARMNELELYDVDDPPRLQGWRRIVVTGRDHPWTGHWWPDGHGLGYEHTFVNLAGDIVRAIGGEETTVPLPDFADAFVTQRVLAAALASAEQRCAVRLREIS